MTRPQIAARASFLVGWFAAVAAAMLVVSAVADASPAHNVTCVAHRGGSHWLPAHTEQTEATWDQAIAANVPVVEGDIRFTSTGYPYLLHDATLGLYGHPTVALASVTGTTASGPTYVSATGDKIQSLYSARTKLLAAPGVRAELELKTVLDADDWAMLGTRLDSLRDRVTLTSFNKATVQAAQEHGYRTGLISSAAEATTEAPIYAIDFGALEPDDVAIHASVGVATETWTIDTVGQWDDAAAAGVTSIVTNDPAGCAVWAAGS